MRRIVSSPWSREECLRRAREDEWLAQQCRTAAGAAELFDRIRLWRSLALVAAPEHPAGPAGAPSPESPPALAPIVQPLYPMPGAVDLDVGCALKRCPLWTVAMIRKGHSDKPGRRYRLHGGGFCRLCCKLSGPGRMRHSRCSGDPLWGECT